MIRRVWFLAVHEVRVFLRYRPSLIWMFGMPLFFMWASGMMAGQGRRSTPRSPILRFEASRPGPVLGAVARYLEGMKYTVRVAAAGTDSVGSDSAPHGASPTDLPERGANRSGSTRAASARADSPRADVVVAVPDDFEAKVARGEKCELVIRAEEENLSGRLHKTRLQRAVIRALADLAVLAVRDSAVNDGSLRRLAERPPAITLAAAPAFTARRIPSGYDQSIPGTLVMFILIVLMTGGTVQLFEDRKQGLLRRIASSPLRRGEIVASRIVARTMIGMIMTIFAMVVGVLVFGVDWGGVNAPFALLVLLVYALAVSGIAILLGSIARSEGQAIGLGVVISIVISALGGCWWPIEIVPRPMQAVAMFLPTGWAMQGLHRLMELGKPPADALPALGMLALYAVVMLALGARKFRFD